MSSTTPIRNRDVMNNHYVMVDGMHTVAEAIQEAISNNVNILVVNKRNHDKASAFGAFRYGRSLHSKAF